MYYLTVENSFDSAHFLHGYEGKCSNLHGHRWRVVVDVACENLISEGQQRYLTDGRKKMNLMPDRDTEEICSVLILRPLV